MRSAVAAVVVFTLIVAGLAVVAVADSPTIQARPLAASRRPTAEQSLYRLGAQSVEECPVPGDGGPDLTDCPDAPPPATAPALPFGSYDRQRAKDEQEVGLK